MSTWTSNARGRWVERCAGELRRRNEALREADAQELVDALWEPRSVRGFDPEMVAEEVVGSQRGHESRRAQRLTPEDSV